MCCCRLLRRSQMFPPAGNLSQSLQFRWVGLFSEQLNPNWKISQAARKALCSSGTPITLLSDMFDLLTLESCEELFKTVEQEVIIDLLQLTPPFSYYLPYHAGFNMEGDSLLHILYEEQPA